MWDEDGIDVFGYRHIWGYAACELKLYPLVLQPFDKFLLIKYYSGATPMEFDDFCNNEVLCVTIGVWACPDRLLTSYDYGTRCVL